MAVTDTAVETPRDVTDEELAFYRANGWVKLERLISPEFATALRDAAAERMGDAVVPGKGGNQKEERVDPRYGTGGKAVDIGMWQDYHFIARDDRVEPMVSFVYVGSPGTELEFAL